MRPAWKVSTNVQLESIDKRPVTTKISHEKYRQDIMEICTLNDWIVAQCPIATAALNNCPRVRARCNKTYSSFSRQEQVADIFIFFSGGKLREGQTAWYD